MKTFRKIFIPRKLKSITVATFTALLPLLFSSTLFAQLQDDFSDNNFTLNPAWSGEVNDFKVHQQVLVLAAQPVTGASFLSTPSAFRSNTVWEFVLTLRFNPSSSNYAQVYLTADDPDLSGPVNGYYVQVGSAADDITLYRQSGSTRLKLIDGSDGRLNFSEVNVRVRVTCSGNKDWTLESDVQSAGLLTTEGRAEDATVTDNSYFGINFVYTSTRSDKFSFDDLRIAPLDIPDTIPPSLTDAVALDDRTLSLSFSEPVAGKTAGTPTFYTVNNGVGTPLSATLAADGTSIQLSFEKPFPTAVPCSVSVKDIEDMKGNRITPTSREFMYILLADPARHDMVISEIFCDPSPAVGLPEAEFVEIFNRSGKYLNTAGWMIADPSAKATLPSLIIAPGQYAIICSAEAGAMFRIHGRTAAVDRLPSLNNAADKLILSDPRGNIIDSVNYDDAWYRESSKASGGWSIERIDPDNFCIGDANWSASVAETGGTPGTVNSVNAVLRDTVPPSVLSAYMTHPDTVHLQFSEPLSGSALPPADFTTNCGSAIVEVATERDFSRLDLVLSSPVNRGEMCAITIPVVADCPGNTIGESGRTVTVVLPEQADSLDVVINEILFNPRPFREDFIELANTSGKYIDLFGWTIGVVKDNGIQQGVTFTTRPFILPPSGFLALSAAPDVIASEYPFAAEKNISKSKLPPFNDDEGRVVLMDRKGRIIDQLRYHEDFHSPFIRDKEGVSLERVRFFFNGNASENWKSAAGSSGYGTPGAVNSAFSPIQDHDETIRIDPEIFAPVFGQPNFTTIHYRFKEPGTMANAVIYDGSGRPVRRLLRNELMSTAGELLWEGETDEGKKAPVGNYMVVFELYDISGNKNIVRKRVAIAGRF